MFVRLDSKEDKLWKSIAKSTQNVRKDTCVMCVTRNLLILQIFNNTRNCTNQRRVSHAQSVKSSLRSQTTWKIILKPFMQLKNGFSVKVARSDLACSDCWTNTWKVIWEKKWRRMKKSLSVRVASKPSHWKSIWSSIGSFIGENTKLYTELYICCFVFVETIFMFTQ